jgi:hypothetical protein
MNQPKRSQLYREKNERICSLYQQGNKPRDVGEIVGLSAERVREILREYKVKKRKRGSL